MKEWAGVGCWEWWVDGTDGGTRTHLTALFLGLPRWASTRKVKPIWILLKQETVSGSGISWAVCKSEPRSRQITTPAPHRSVFYRSDALPAAQPTASKHWRETEGEVPLKELGESELERLVRGWWREAESLFQRRGAAYCKERSVIHREDDVDGRASVTKDEERVLQGGWSGAAYQNFFCSGILCPSAFKLLPVQLLSTSCFCSERVAFCALMFFDDLKLLEHWNGDCPVWIRQN